MYMTNTQNIKLIKPINKKNGKPYVTTGGKYLQEAKEKQAKCL